MRFISSGQFKPRPAAAPKDPAVELSLAHQKVGSRVQARTGSGEDELEAKNSSRKAKLILEAKLIGDELEAKRIAHKKLGSL